MRTTLSIFVAAWAVTIVESSPAFAAIPRATYRFNSSLAADEPQMPTLIATDPLGQNGFEMANVLGQARMVYLVDGNALPTDEQAGLTLLTAGLLPADDYSVELVVEFLEHDFQWRRIIDVQDRQSDNGFYVDPSNRLNIYPVVGSTDSFQLNTFYHVVLTNDHQNVSAYLNGHLELATTTSVMDINNAGLLLHLFLDNVVGGGQGEFSDARIALARFYEGALTPSEVATQALDPFGTQCNGHRGDLNDDGAVNDGDVPAFVAVLLGNDADGEHVARTDVNCDGAADGLDIQPLVNQILGP